MLEFRVLGPLEIGSDEAPVRVSGRKERAVLAALLLDPGRARPAEELVAAVWGEDAPPTAEKSLQVRLSHLRAALADGRDVARARRARLPAGGRSRRASTPCRFERLVDEAAAQHDPAAALDGFDEALALVRGRPYADVEEFDGLASEVRRLDELRMRARRGAAARAARPRPPRRGAARARPPRAATSRTTRRSPACSCSRCTAPAGRSRRCAAYRLAAERLRELGLEPSEELRRLEGQILTQSDELARAADAAQPPRSAAPGRARRARTCRRA